MSAAAALAAIALCTFKPHTKKGEPCNEPASHRFRWDYGDEGHACPECIPLMQQAAKNIKRSVTFSRLEEGQQEPVTLHERTHLIAAKLSAEEELKQVTLRGQQLYQANVSLTQQVQTLVMQKREVDAELARTLQQRDETAERLSVRETELAEVIGERDRLQVLVPFVGKPTTPEERGLPSSTVDG
jgi:uncharacterized protein YifE (UPF0438 family)